MDCNCDIDFNCGAHQDEYDFWAAYFGATRPTTKEVEWAYEPTDYKGRFHEGWN